VKPDVFAAVVVALANVTTIADRLLDGDSEGHVRRSIEEFAVAFTRREPIAPAVARLRTSIVMLYESRAAGARRAFERDKALIGELDAAIEEELLPALRRLGFELTP
jgi:hypothetical protein